MKAEFEPAARQDMVESIRWYLGEAGMVHAAAFEGEIRRVIDLLVKLPELGAQGPSNTRSLRLRRYPYSIHYRLDFELIRIIAIAHHSRRPGYWVKRS